MPSAVKMQSPYHWTAREFPVLKFAKRKTEVKFPLSLAIGRTSLWLSLAGQTNSDSLGLPGSWALRKEKRNSCLLNRPCRRNRMAYSLQEKQDLEALGPNQKCKKKKKGGVPFPQGSLTRFTRYLIPRVCLQHPMFGRLSSLAGPAQESRMLPEA